jgi:uncharacterized membrane protein
VFWVCGFAIIAQHNSTDLWSIHLFARNEMMMFSLSNDQKANGKYDCMILSKCQQRILKLFSSIVGEPVYNSNNFDSI